MTFHDGKMEKVVIIGGGNWATVLSCITASNLSRICVGTDQLGRAVSLSKEVVMWVHQEDVDGRLLTDIINEDRVNRKYLPGVPLPAQVRAEPDLPKALLGATLLLFVIPHQFLAGILPQIKTALLQQTASSSTSMPRIKAISLIKGVSFEDMITVGRHSRASTPFDTPSNGPRGEGEADGAFAASDAPPLNPMTSGGVPPVIAGTAVPPTAALAQGGTGGTGPSSGHMRKRLRLISDLIREGLAGVNKGRFACSCAHGLSSPGAAVHEPTLACVPSPCTACVSHGCHSDDGDVAVLMGANVANEVIQGQFCEATVGYDGPVGCSLDCTCGHARVACTSQRHAELWMDLLGTASFQLSASPDWATIELCGALKNVVALAAGFVDALGCGSNSKAAVMRRGLVEMKHAAELYCAGWLGPINTHGDGARLAPPLTDTFLQSCGVADLVTTCYGGRNRKCAEAFARLQLANGHNGKAAAQACACAPAVVQHEGAMFQAGQATGEHSSSTQESTQVAVAAPTATTMPEPSDTSTSKVGMAATDSMTTAAIAAARWEQVEAELLGGQKMQGLSTCLHVHAVLASIHLPAHMLNGNDTRPGAVSTLQHARYRQDGHERLPGALSLFPLFHAIHQISTGAMGPEQLFTAM